MEDKKYIVESDLYNIDGKKYQRIVSPMGIAFYREVKDIPDEEKE